MKVDHGECWAKIAARKGKDDEKDPNFHYYWYTFSKKTVDQDSNSASPVQFFNRPVSSSRNKFGIGKQEVVIFFHGAGQSSCSFLPLILSLSKTGRQLFPLALVAFDARGHGKTNIDNESNLSLDVLTADALAFIDTVCETGAALLLIGHSLGGAVATSVAKQLSSKYKLLGLMLIDIVEGSALESIADSQSVIKCRPKRFSSVQSAIDWAMKRKIIKNRSQAAITFPGQMRQLGSECFEWRTDLEMTFPFWKGWFQGLSANFLSVPVTGKLLLVGGWNRLDTELTTAQMQGKFKLVMAPMGIDGHFLHEDAPDYVAHIVADFIVRNGLAHSNQQREGFTAQQILAMKAAGPRVRIGRT
eukprot:CAMPEP_0184006312 /NCGR_PEP_ID=MMETSP0954-20121128/606_1 /TAXON_ID=627963 /ORGANISM="Aplanochytrium sp, Strain PBS07" /LENGTH=358 /DNA_ID=CAMNT_0026284813 /DNA_START=635 /DNA_END=1711 /DNA_ORIENTATION=-